MAVENITTPETGSSRVIGIHQLKHVENQLLQLEALLYAIKTLDNGDEHVTKTLAGLGEDIAAGLVGDVRELKNPVEITQAAA